MTLKNNRAPLLCNIKLFFFAWASLLSIVMTPENFIMMRRKWRCEKGVKDGRTVALPGMTLCIFLSKMWVSWKPQMILARCILHTCTRKPRVILAMCTPHKCPRKPQMILARCTPHTCTRKPQMILARCIPYTYTRRPQMILARCIPHVHNKPPLQPTGPSREDLMSVCLTAWHTPGDDLVHWYIKEHIIHVWGAKQSWYKWT